MSETLSILAFALSVFTLYWTTFHRRKAFYLVRIDTLNGKLDIEFALVNGGKEDLLVTKTLCGIESGDGKTTAFPSQHLSITEGGSLLLQAGKAFHCRIAFQEPLDPYLADGAKDPKGSETFLMSRLGLNIEWVDPSGQSKSRMLWLYKCGTNSKGAIMQSPLNERYDLYAEKS